MAGSQRGAPTKVQAASFQGISSVNKLSLPDQVFISLRDALMCGRFAPGQRVPLRVIAEALGTSTMPAREAVNRLVAMDALEYLPNRRVSVPILSVERYREISIARGVIEPAAAERATLELTDDELSRLQAMHREMRAVLKGIDQAGAIQKYIELDKTFFFTIYAANRSPVLMAAIESFWIKTGPYLNIIVGEGGTRLKGDQVKPVLDALLARDPAGVKAAVFRNIETAARYILENDKLGEMLNERPDA